MIFYGDVLNNMQIITILSSYAYVTLLIISINQLSSRGLLFYDSFAEDAIS